MLVPYMTDAILNKLVREHGQVRMIQYMHIYVLLTARISWYESEQTHDMHELSLSSYSKLMYTMTVYTIVSASLKFRNMQLDYFSNI